MKAVVLLNRDAGTLDSVRGADAPHRIEAAFREHGVASEIRHVPPKAMAKAALAALRDPEASVVVGGGDGTLSAVAHALAGTGRPLGVLPLGTLNHFAKDLGIPASLEEAVRLIAEGHVRSIDVGEVNGRVFLNNSSLGFYPRVVKDRKAQRAERKIPKWYATAVAAWRALERFPQLDVRIEVGGETVERRTPLVFVGNNAYDISLFAMNSRARLDGGELSLCVANPADRLELVRLAAMAVQGKVHDEPKFDTWRAPGLTIHVARKTIDVAVDGEVFRMRPPLVYRTRPGDLLVFANAEVPVP